MESLNNDEETSEKEEEEVDLLVKSEEALNEDNESDSLEKVSAENDVEDSLEEISKDKPKIETLDDLERYLNLPIWKTPVNRAKATFSNMIRRCKGGKAEEKAYAEVEVKMTRSEWLEWAVPKYETFLKQDPDGMPTVSRNGDIGHYELDNIRIVPWKENSIEQHLKRERTWLERTCPECGEIFIRCSRNVNFKERQGKTVTCSRRCGGVRSHKIKNGVLVQR